ncbi:MAG: NAD(P)-dependent oxidoreductase [Desulfobacteraceae bacterium]|jgi:nucleoside-diphosphate-sugar epimerase
MRIFLTGASGFIGAHVLEKLLSGGHHVAALISPDNPMSRLQLLKNDFSITKATLEDTQILEKTIDEFKPEACIHLAWYAEPGEYLNSDKNIQSLSSSLALFRMLINAGCRHIIGAGTCFEYDTSFGYLKEDTSARPESLYAATKLSCFLTGTQLAVKNDVAFSWARIFYPYGPKENPKRLVPGVISSLKEGIPFPSTTGEQIRDYIHVCDVASAFSTLLEKKADGIYNISSGSPVSIRQLLETIAELMNKKDLIQAGAIPYRKWEPPFICGDNTQLKNLGWTPEYSLYDGLKGTINSF